MYLAGTASTFLMFASIGLVLPRRYGVWSYLAGALLVDLLLILKFIFGFFSWQALLCSGLGFILQMIVFPVILYRAAWWKCICLALYFMMGMVLAEGYTFALYGKDPEGLFISGEITTYIVSCFAICFLFNILSVLAFRFISMRRFRKFYLLFIIFPVSWLLIIQYILLSLPDIVFYTAMLLGFLSCFALLYYTLEQEKKTALEQELRDIRHTMELEQSHYRAMEERREELARIRHDFNNQLAVIGRLVESGEKEDAGQMIRCMAEDIDRTKENPYCTIPVVNAVLQEKAQICMQKHIDLKVELEMPENLSVEPLHLCSIFANLLDNAIRAAQHCGIADPSVSVTGRMDGDYLFIKTVNPSKPPEPVSAGHGCGSRILKDLSDRYGGGYHTAYENGLFTANVSLLAAE